MNQFDLDAAIKNWLKTFRKHSAFNHGSIREMEVHLRDHIDDLEASGHSKEEAFDLAVKEFGDVQPMAKEEFLNLRPGITTNSIINLAMLNNYLKIAFRNFWNHKFYAFVNVFGLTMGFTIVFMIGLFVNDELSFDQFNVNKDNLYRVVENQYYADQPVFPVAVTPTALAPALVNEFPEIINSTRYQGTNTYRFVVGDKTIMESDGVIADVNFFEMFSYKIIHGSIEGFKENQHAIVLNSELAEKFFSNQDPIGKTITIDDRESEVIAVIENAPNSSHLSYRYFLNFEAYLAEDPERANSWGSNWLYTYVQLEDGTDHNLINEKIIGLIKANNEGSVTDIYLQPLLDIYLGEVDFVVETSRKGEKMYVQMFSIVAIFILLISCINFMNLSTASAAKRSKEVGLRKTVGAHRHQLIWQFMSESILVTLTGVVLSFLIIALLLPSFNILANKEFDLIELINSSKGFNFIIAVLVIAIITGIIAGSYPAFYLSGLQPISSVNSTKSKGKKGSLIRKGLVVFQFAISVVLIIGTMVVYKQLQFIQNVDLGYNRHNILYTFINDKQAVQFTNELRVESDIVAAGLSNRHPAYALSSTSGMSWPGKNPEDVLLMHFMGVDEHYIDLMEIKLKEGKGFESGDTASVIINEKALETMGLTNPIGQIINNGPEEYKIVGIAEDFNFKSIHTPIEPMIMFKLQEASRVFIRYKPENLETIAGTVQSVWERVVPDREFDYYFLDDDFATLYHAEDRTKILSSYFAIFAILISCLGLFGLVSYATEQRTKEVGVRKVLGASVSNLFLLLTGDFTKLVFISLLFSIPLGWFIMSKWLDNFAFRIDLTAGIFILSAISALLIALITVSYQTIKVSISNPVKALRNE